MIKKENIFLVGGAVRDIVLGEQPKDKDYVVINHNESDMLAAGFTKVGKDFPVFLDPNTNEEYALARKEKKIHSGYSGFVCETENVTLEEDLYRRDLTINAMAINHDNVIIDPFGGLNDLKNGTLRHVSEHFCEDPVRILRICRFSARYNFIIHPTTNEFMKKMVFNGEFDSLTKERVWKEFEKSLTEPYLKNFFINLDNCNGLSKILSSESIPNFDFFDFIKNSLKKENQKIANLLHIFSKTNKTELNQWKIPNEYKQKILHYFKVFSEGKCYFELNTEEKIKFIHNTRAIHNTNTAEEIINLFSLYKAYIDNTSYNHIKKLNISFFKQDLEKLKQLDYSTMIDFAKNNNLNIEHYVLNEQKKELCITANPIKLKYKSY